jgi:hypothetical protein
MRKMMMLLSAVALGACAPADDETFADSPAAAMAPALSYADFAGRWNLQLLSDMSDSVIATYDLTATADGAGWTLTPLGGDPIPLRTAIDSDSLMLDAGPYRLTGQTADVTTHAVGRIEGGMLVGTFVSQHAVPAADSVVRGRVRGTRLP